MELQQLRNFICVAEHKNISRAARELLISQPALSRSIRSLEEDVGTVLIVRGAHGVELTAQGQRLLVYARDMLAAEAQIRRELQETDLSVNTIYIICRCLERFLPGILHTYRQQSPQVDFVILQNDDIALQNHQYDLIVSGSLYDEAGYSRQTLMSERFLCVLPADAVPEGKTVLTQEEFSSMPQIQFGGHRQVQWSIRQQLHQNGLVYHPRTICDDVRTGCNLVAAGFGTLIVPEYALDLKQFTHVRMLPIEGIDIRRDVYLYHRSNAYLPTHVEKFAAFLVRYCRQCAK